MSWQNNKQVEKVTKISPLKVIGGALLVVACLAILFVGIGEAVRYNRVRNANNKIRVIDRQIEQTIKLVELEEQKAEIRIAEAEGIAEAQRIIDASLTENYLTYEAIKAQLAMADSPNDTVIYIPVGSNGIPLVATVDDEVSND